MRRVVVTGLGVVAPNGIGKDAFWKACVEGKSGVGPIECFDASHHPVKIAGEVKGLDIHAFMPNGHGKHVKNMGRAARFGVAASGLALQDSGLTLETLDPERFGVTMGTGIIPMELPDIAPALAKAYGEDGAVDTQKLGDCGAGAVYPQWLLKYLPNMVASHVSIRYNAQGPNNTIVTACAAGTQAIGEAMRIISRGEADVMLAGGADSRLDPFLLLAYTSLGALSRANRPAAEVSRPFDGERDGFVLGEGAGVLLLEDLDHAKARGAIIYAEVTGYASSFDAFGITKPDPEGKGAARSMRWALKDAQVDEQDVDYINAHGTSTRLNDQMETVAVKRVFDEKSYGLPMSSIKSMIGHLIGAAGAVEAVAMALTLKDGVLPPTINYTKPDPQCDLDYVPNSAREVRVRTALSNSFGFGGQNASIVMQQFRA